MELHVDFSKWDPEVQKQYLLNRSAELDVRRGELEVRRAELEIRRLEAEAQIATATAQKANAEARKSVEVFPGEMRKCNVKSSKLASSNSLAHVALPVGPDCYYAPRPAIINLIGRVHELQGVVNNDVLSCLKNLQYWKSAHTFSTPVSPEDSYTRPNLDFIMRQIFNCIQSKDLVYKSRFNESSGNAVGDLLNFIFAKSGSLLEPVITLKLNCSSVCLIVSEAKSLDASMFKTYAQAIQLAADCAVNISCRYGDLISCQEVVIPIVTTTWDDVQFGALYLMDNNYPCSVLLSRRLSLSCRHDMLQICYWIISLAQHCIETAEKLASLFQDFDSAPFTGDINFAKKSRKSPREVHNLVVSLPDTNKHLFKPVSLREGYGPFLFRALLSGIMSRFYDLYHFGNGALRHIVVFPEGVIAFPEDTQQPELVNDLKQNFDKLCRMKSVSRDSYEPYCVVGYPIVVYRLLEEAEWQRSDTLLFCNNEALVRGFIESLREASELVCEAGIIYTDLRLYNIFYGLNIDQADEYQFHASAVTRMNVKIIDWDDSVRVGEYVPVELLEERRHHPDFPVNAPVATSESYHDFFIKNIEIELMKQFAHDG